MDNILGIGLWEFALVVILAFIIFGPRDLARHAYTLGRQLGKFSRQAREILAMLNEQLAAEADIADLKDDVVKLGQEMNEIRRNVSDISNLPRTFASNLVNPPDSKTPAKPPVNAKPVDLGLDDEFAGRSIAPPGAPGKPAASWSKPTAPANGQPPVTPANAPAIASAPAAAWRKPASEPAPTQSDTPSEGSPEQ